MRTFLLATLFGCLSAAAGLGQRLTFDVASVKIVNLASHPTFGNRGGPGTADPGRIHLCCVGMFSLLMRAYDVEIDQIIGPGWIMENMGPNLYEIDATMSPATTRVQFQSMMQDLLAERFGLEVHREQRHFPGYELVVAKGGPRLKESLLDLSPTADPIPRSLNRQAGGYALLPKGPQLVTTLGRGMIVIQGQEKTIGELAKILGRTIAQSLGENMNDFTSPKPRVIDRTGLTRKFDFMIEFSCEGCASFGGMTIANGAMARAQTADEPLGNGLPNVFVALEKQIGLRLVKTKDIRLDVIVVDRVSKLPAEN
jgi:uncharacterized protein (TIGR03435 family)